MARGRFLSDSVAKDLKLNSLSVEAELVYLLTIPHLDRDGLIEGDTDILFGTVCPKRRQLQDRIGDFIQEWIKVGLVMYYLSDDGPVLWFKGFAKNQIGLRYDREVPSKFPPPPSGEVPSVSDILPDASNNCSPHAHADARPEFQSQVELEVELEVKAFVAPTAATSTPQQEMFAAVCEAIGWDYHTLSKDDKGQVAQAAGIFAKNSYTIDDLHRFMVDVWFKDWRWTKEGQHPTLKQLRQEIGKIRSLIPSVAPPVNQNGYDTFKAIAKKKGLDL